MIHDRRFKQLQKIYENMEEEKMYHGTSNQFDKPSFDKIFWVTPSKELATEYSQGAEVVRKGKANVKEYDVEVKHPAKVTKEYCKISTLLVGFLENAPNKNVDKQKIIQLKNKIIETWFSIGLDNSETATHNHWNMGNNTVLIEFLEALGYDSIEYYEYGNVTYGIWKNDVLKEDSEDDLLESPQEPLQDSNGNTIENPKRFLKWFNGSKIVDASGKPLVCYHGTKQAFDKVNVKMGSQGIFWLSSSKDKIIRGESGAVSSKVVLEFYVKIKNPAGWKEYEQYSTGELIGLGFDGVVLKDSEGFDIIIFENNQVMPVKKSLLEESSKTFIVKASQLYSPQWKIEDTKKNLEKGLLSRTEGPITVSKIGPGKYYLMNGNHRVIQGIISGKDSFETTLDKHIPDMSKTGGGYSNEIKNAVQVVSVV